MKSTILLIALFAVNSASAQLKKIDETLANGNEEQYTVLKTNHSIKEGKCVLYRGLQHFFSCEGFYKNNLKDSLWKYYNYNGKKIVESGYYKDGNKSGVWDAMDNKGELNVKYDYSNRKLLFFKPNEHDTGKNLR